MAIKVLFVCEGNIFRSPAAAALFRKEADHLGKADHFEVKSAGVAPNNDPPDERVVRMVETLGGKDYFKQSSEPVTSDHMDWADIVIAMEDSHKRFMVEKSPEAESKIGVWGIPDVIEDLESEAFSRMLEIKNRSECLADEMAWNCEFSTPWLEEIGVRSKTLVAGERAIAAARC